MAVQAQHPSNVLFLNRNLQDVKGKNEYSFQQHHHHLGGGTTTFVDQTRIRLNPTEVSNSRKRVREDEMMNSTQLISMQSQQQPKIIDLTQLHTSSTQPNNVVSTGLRLSLGEQQQQQSLQFHVSPQSSQSPLFFSFLAEDLSSHIKHQSNEIDNFLRAQGEELRRGIEERRQRHYRTLLRTAEETAARRVREAEAEVEAAARRNSELHARASQLISEAQAWQARAKEHEITVATLQAQLQQAMLVGKTAPPPETAACGGGGEAEDAESGYVDPDRVGRVVELTRPCCKICRKNIAAVVVLPCRHLCLCAACDAAARVCPLCFSGRSSSVEVFLC